MVWYDVHRLTYSGNCDHGRLIDLMDKSVVGIKEGDYRRKTSPRLSSMT